MNMKLHPAVVVAHELIAAVLEDLRSLLRMDLTQRRRILQLLSRTNYAGGSSLAGIVAYRNDKTALKQMLTTHVALLKRKKQSDDVDAVADIHGNQWQLQTMAVRVWLSACPLGAAPSTTVFWPGTWAQPP